jgi:pimeloyl-ACP methyl ester carboxylesterase
MAKTSGLAGINGAQIYYETRGAGPPLLLVHAGVADSRMWDDQVVAFSEHYQVIRFDLRGFGRSTMPSGSFSNIGDIRALLQHLNIDATYLLGISFGGAIALDFSLTHPERVRALILGAPSVGGAKPSARIRQFWQEEETALESGNYDEATEINLRLWVDGPGRPAEEVYPGVRERVRAMQLAIFEKDIPDDIEEIDLDPPAIERLGEVKAPLQLIVGDLDLPEKIELTGRLADEIPGASMAVIPGVAHMLNMEKPELFNQIVLDFLAGVNGD